MMQTRRLCVGILLAAGALYGVLLAQHYVGFLNDDVCYLLAARSLWQGRYVQSYLPEHPYLIHYLPGFPFFLAPFARLASPHWEWLKLLPWTLTLFCGALLWDCLGDSQPGEKTWVLFLFLFNPTTVFSSGLLISEMWFLALVLWIAIRLDKVLARPESGWETWSLGVLSGWCVLTRPEGVALLLPFGLLAVSPAHRPKLARIMGVAALMWLGWAARNIILTGRWSDHAEELPSSLTRPLLLRQAWALTDTFLVQGAGGFVYGARGAVGIALVGALVACAFAGLLRLRSEGLRLHLKVLLGFGLGYLLIHAVWLVDIRYCLPFFPVIFLLVVKGALSPRWRGWGMSLCGVLACSALWQDAAMVRGLFAHTLPAWSYRPQETLAWAASALPRSARTMSDKEATVYLYTGHYCHPLPIVESREELRYSLLSRGIGYVLVFPNPSNDRADLRWGQAAAWMSGWPQGFRLVYSNPREMTAVFQVMASGDFQRAFELYLSSHGDLLSGRWQQGFAKLDAALKLYPDLPGALNDYGASLLDSGGDVRRARAMLLEALRLRPGFPPALANLERLDDRSRR
jgi:hypothetical protein